MSLIYFLYFLIFITLYITAISITYMKFVEGIFIKLPRQNLSIYITVILSSVLFIFIVWDFISLHQSSPKKASFVFLLSVLLILLILATILTIEIRNEMIRKEDYKRKKNKLIQTLKANPDNFGLILKMANIYYQEGNLDEALSCYKRAISLLKNPELSLKAKEKIKEIEYEKTSQTTKYPVECPYCHTQNLRYSFRCKNCHKRLHSSFKDWIYSFTNIYERISLLISIIMFFLFLFTLPIIYPFILFILLVYIIIFLIH